MSKPILKWAGGKSDLIPLIEEKIKRVKNIDSTLYDVFAGGGSVAFAFAKEFKKVILNDTNKELINLYTVVKTNPEILIHNLDLHQKNHNPDYYYQIRNWDRDKNFDKVDDIMKAARTVYLNKACYNGLYRVNLKGQFNVPIGSREKINLYDHDNLMEISQILRDIKLMNADYYEAISSSKKGDIVYFDPPYDKVNDQSFIGYNGKQFDEFDQNRLAFDIKQLTERGVYVIFSNAATDRVKKLYKEYLTPESYIPVLKRISSKSDGRRYIEEILGDNFNQIKS